MKNISKKDAERMIEDFFLDIKNKNSRLSQARSGQTKSLAKQVKKIKSLAMNKKILLKEKRKLFCQKCLAPYSGKEKIRIKKGMKSIECTNCGKVNRWKVR